MRLIDLKEIIDDKGNLVVIESNDIVPFDIKRLFYIYGVGNIVRGEHANINSQFCFICLNGSCKIKVDNGDIIKEFLLDNKRLMLYIDKMVWKDMYDFSDDCLLLVLSDHKYDSSEYIRDYYEFIERRKI